METMARKHHEKIKLVEINSYLTCYLCKGYLIDATTISECLHSFCRSCIIKFLQENCYCPVCEVIINKAKPCLKLDKTLQDIVYKLVPELFINEMLRRKQFYQNHPQLLMKTTPEERGEDTERTIFNPQDAISLSIEYISDDSSPGAITVPSLISDLKKLKNDYINNENHHNQQQQHDNPMKRYLQCPGMCRIEVLKKFVCNKYNVDTTLFHIDILYKRVPLPDHYTLIDIGYIYSWKRNEPMKFFFRITDINKLSERFDYFDGKTTLPDELLSLTTPPPPPPTTTTKTTTPIKTTRCVSNKVKNCEKSRVSKVSLKRIETIHKQQQQQQQQQQRRQQHKIQIGNNNKIITPPPISDDKKKLKVEVIESEHVPIIVKNNNNNNNNSETSEPDNKTIGDKKDEKEIKKSDKWENEQKDENKVKVKEKSIDNKNNNNNNNKCGEILTNSKLNQSDNGEKLTKTEKTKTNQDTHGIDKNTTNNKVQTNTVPPTTPNNNNNNNNNCDNNNSNSDDIHKKGDSGGEIMKKLEKERDEDLEKSNFLKSIELTARNTLLTTTTKTKTSTIAATLTVTKPLISSAAVTTPIVTTPTTTTTTSSQKRKNSSPMKNDKKQKNLKTTIEKKPMKILIQPKTIQNPTIRQIVSNVNQNVTNLTKIVEQTTSKTTTTTTTPNNITTNSATPTTTTTTDLRSIIDNCRLNIPSSLSITLNEGENNPRTPPSILPPVKNYIEILKLPDNSTDSNNKNRKIDSPTTSDNNCKTTPTKDSGGGGSNGETMTRNQMQSFQKIFEESIKKRTETSPNNNNDNDNNHNNNNNNDDNNSNTTDKTSPLDLTNSDSCNSNSNSNGNNNSNSGVGGGGGGGGGTKRKILEIASQLHNKKSKLELEKQSNNTTTTPIITSTLLSSTTTTLTTTTTPLTTATMHSSSLGLNYTVSIDKKQSTNFDTKKCVLSPKLLSPPPPPPPSSRNPPLYQNRTKAKSLSPNHINNNNNNNNNNNHSKMVTTTKSSQLGNSVANNNNKLINANQLLLEKYNLQNLAQLTANFNFNPACFITTTASGGGGGDGDGNGGGGTTTTTNISNNNNNNNNNNNATANIQALQHAMLLKHIEQQQQNWLNLNQAPLLQYEKYLQSLSQNQKKIVANLKDN